MGGISSLNAPNLSGLTTAQQINALNQYIVNVAGTSLYSFDQLQDKAQKAARDGATEANQAFYADVGNPFQYIAKPTITLPPVPDVSSLNVNFDTALAQVTGVVNGLQNSWLMSYFPATMPNGFDPLMQQILAGAIVTQTQQDLLWGRAKAQGLRDVARMEDEAVNRWASRGFSMPGGVVENQINKAQQESLHVNAGFAAQQAIKALDLQVDAVKFAADKGTELRLGLINGLTGLVTAYSHLPAAAAEYASAVSAARRASYEAIAEYYRTVLMASELTLKVDMANQDNMIRSSTLAGDWIGKYTNSYIEAMERSINNYAETAGRALSGMNSITNISASA